jgi:hypothetical protein
MLLLLMAALPAWAFTFPWDAGRGWPTSSRLEVAPLDLPDLSQSIEKRGVDPAGGFRFAVTGDQRALADGEWQQLLQRLKDASDADRRLLFLIDTGDIVNDGRHSDQFARLREILSKGPVLPYLVCVGNHEVRENARGTARANTARFLSRTDSTLDAARLYYRKDVGAIHFYFLDSNDLVYGDGGDRLGLAGPLPGSRAEAQMRWLTRELAQPLAPQDRRIVVMHHPILASSAKHQDQTRDLWRYQFDGRSFPDILADGQVDLVLTGHTHTYESFLLHRSDGREITLVNFSGRPRESDLWFGGSARKARDLRGREGAWLAAAGWTNLDRWQIHQQDVMPGSGSDQFGLFTVGSDGSLAFEVTFLRPERAGGAGRSGSIRIR